MQSVISTLKAGGYYLGTNPTWGTGLAASIVTAYDATKPLVVIRNTSAPAAGATAQDLIPLWIRLICTAAGSSSTASDLALVLDPSNRYTSGGTSLVMAQTNSAIGETFGGTVHVGVIVAPAVGASVRYIGRAKVKTQASPCWALGDQVLITFGEVVAPFAAPPNGTATIIVPVQFPPVVIAGRNTTHSLLLHMWNTDNATTAPSFEVEVALMQL
mgnify:CR=1 FL=1